MAFSAIYPRAIPTFTQKRNVIDDVDASDINLLQREVQAIASILGVDPHIAFDVTLPTETVVAAPGDEGGISTDYNAPRTPADPTRQVINYGTVSARLDALEKGQIPTPDVPVPTGKHCFKLTYDPPDDQWTPLPYQETPKITTPFKWRTNQALRFPKPATADDPFEYWNGVGVTIKKTGFWSISLEMHLRGRRWRHYGDFWAAIVASGGLQLRRGEDKKNFRYYDWDDEDPDWVDEADWDHSAMEHILTPRLEGWFKAGETVTVYVDSRLYRIYKDKPWWPEFLWVTKAVFTGCLIREWEMEPPPTPPVKKPNNKPYPYQYYDSARGGWYPYNPSSPPSGVPRIDSSGGTTAYYPAGWPKNPDGSYQSPGSGPMAYPINYGSKPPTTY